MSRGGGRGALMRKIMELSASDTEKLSDSGALGDSGIGDSKLKTRETFESDKSKSDSNGTKPELSETFSSGIPPQAMPGGRGRAKLLEALAQRSVISTTTESSGDAVSNKSESKTSGGEGKSKFIGRGKMFHELSDTMDSVEKGASTDPISSDMSNLNISDEKIEPEAVIKRGNKGQPVTITSNYLRMKSEPDRGLYEYDVKFTPNVDSHAFRFKFLNQHAEILGTTKVFDGLKLSLPFQLPNVVTDLISTHPTEETKIKVVVTYRRKKRLAECIDLYNNLFSRIMKILNFVQFGQKKFDPTEPIIIPQHKLEIWPGYVTAVDEYEGGLMLCLDVSHRVLCQTTVLEHLSNVYRSDSARFRENSVKSLLGQVVLTRYNNRTYRIDDIEFSMNPLSTFETKNEGAVSYVKYYKEQYNIQIQDLKQPLLISRKERRVSGKDQPEEMTFCIIPEICYLTGLRDEIRNDVRVMRDLATHTRVTPNQRMFSFKKFVENVNSNPDAKKLLSSWGLSLDYPTAKCQGRVFENEVVLFGNNKSENIGPNADFSRHITNNPCIDVVDFSNWLLIYTKKDTKYADNFVELLSRNAKPMGITVSRPKVEILQTDRNEVYVQALRQRITPETQIVVIICPTSRDDRYAAIKKVCCTEIPVPSQVINARTLSNDAKNRSIVQKIALQMNCKMGGTLWGIKIPFQNVMICGIDTYHDAGNKSNSISAFVASQNRAYTRWYSRAVVQSKKEEFINGLCASLKFALDAYKKLNGCYPDRIIIFRDGVSDGQLKICSEYEIPQMREACKLGSEDYDPKITFIVVQKRINTRLFTADRNNELANPAPGTVVDNTVTRKHLYDYFLVSQNVRQGTVSPTHYIVVLDDADFPPDTLQRLSYKMCFLYYNWPGSVRVPACCQYAHKLAYLVGQSVKRQPAEKLSDKLFYL